MIIWFNSFKGWENSTWIGAWSIVGKVREFCDKNEYIYEFVNDIGSPSRDRLPNGIRFIDVETALVFKLTYE